ncbi:hypothetical protein EMIT0P12_60027 [Pseudomonas sp. IT-P12]
MADAKPQAVEGILITELRDDVAQAVVTAMAAALLEFGDARRQVEFVVRHQDFFGFDAEETGKCRDGLAAAVHVGGGNQQTNILTLMRVTPGQAEILAIGHKIHTLCVRDALNKKGPCVVPGLFVFSAWISQANDQFDGSHDRGPSLKWWMTSLQTVQALKVDEKCSFTMNVNSAFPPAFSLRSSPRCFRHSGEQSEITLQRLLR